MRTWDTNKTSVIYEEMNLNFAHMQLRVAECKYEYIELMTDVLYYRLEHIKGGNVNVA